MALLTGFGGLLLGAAGIFLPLTAYREHRDAQRLVDQGIPGEGIVVEKLVVPNGRTLRLRYKVTAADGQVAEHGWRVKRPECRYHSGSVNRTRLLSQRWLPP